jgi:DNA invertase Pin-like site-specific DNA recombinase
MYNNKVYAYLRVSTHMQNNEKFKSNVLSYANSKSLGHVNFVEDIISGSVKDWHKLKIKGLIESCAQGDVIIIPELSRLGRNTLNIMTIVQEMKDKGIILHVIKGCFIVDNSVASKIMLGVFGLVAELERDLLSLRSIEGLARARREGKLLGRPRGSFSSKLDVHEKEIRELLKNGSSKTFIANFYKTSRSNLNSFLKKKLN